MTREELYSIWAPSDSPWSPWVMPVAFAQLPPDFLAAAPAAPARSPWMLPGLADQIQESTARSLNSLSVPEIDWSAVGPPATTALVVDLPGDQSVMVGAAAIARGYRPIPVFASAAGPAEVLPGLPLADNSPGVAVSIGPVLRAILDATPRLAGASLALDSPPVFLLDARRMSPQVPVTDGVFDNRSKIFPEDFPSARFLREHGIARVILVQQARVQPQGDLSHVLLRWQDAGIAILAAETGRSEPAVPITVERPSRYRALWYRALAMIGLKRHNVGGFGGFQGEWGGAG